MGYWYDYWIRSLDHIMKRYKLSNLDRIQQVAVARIQIAAMAEIQEQINLFSSWILRLMKRGTNTEGFISDSNMTGIYAQLDAQLTNKFADIAEIIEIGRVQAANVGFGPYRLRHNTYIKQGFSKDITEAAFAPTPGDFEKLAEMWINRRNSALQVASQRVFSDKLVLSQRIWRIRDDGLTQIRGILAQGMTDRTSAARLSIELERALGTNQDWPRWARSRLSKMDARQRLVDKTGLLRSPADVPAGRSQGLSYNALRLARNEIQYANHAVTTDIAVSSPWIIGRKVRLSPSHPKIDVCDEAAGGGPYPPSSNFLPLHPQCLCRWEEVLMPPDQFQGQMRGWVAGDNSFLDPYLSWLGQRAVYPIPEQLSQVEAQSMFNTMENWMEGNTDTMARVFKG